SNVCFGHQADDPGHNRHVRDRPIADLISSRWSQRKWLETAVNDDPNIQKLSHIVRLPVIHFDSDQH
ncbi:MAG: hypothetical protein V2J55_20825, partial [Candidatus Competibacteraceae bacterium]|nr:hypothetical protein [Candidatus Competibacteraceae bacterium]